MYPWMFSIFVHLFLTALFSFATYGIWWEFIRPSRYDAPPIEHTRRKTYFLIAVAISLLGVVWSIW